METPSEPVPVTKPTDGLDKARPPKLPRPNPKEHTKTAGERKSQVTKRVDEDQILAWLTPPNEED